MLRDVFYYGTKPNAHPRERYAENLEDARNQATTRDFWIINEFCDYRNFDWDFDFEFLPDEDVWAEDHNNVWPSQHQKDSGTWLCPKEHSDITIYRCDVDPVKRKNDKSENWVELDLIDPNKFDFSWHPDPTDPPYIYKWGCKFFPAEIKHVLEYRVPGATQEKYMDVVVELLPEVDRWLVPNDIDQEKFDFSWRPNPLDPPFVYEFATQWQKNGGPKYIAHNALETKYTEAQKAIRLPCKDNWNILENIDESQFDFSWHPDNTAPPLIYAWGNQWNQSVDKVSVEYIVPGATDYQYMDERAIRLPDKSNWIIPDNIDDDGFDYSWEPSPASPPYIYEFATQWQKTGGPQYVVSEATEKKYVDFQKVKRLPSDENWTVPDNIDPSGFDFSWHPDNTSPPYVYVFATQWALSGGPVYTVPGATDIKYTEDQNATAVPRMDNWVYNEDTIDIDKFDFSWHPYAGDDPYIYQFGTQWWETGGPKYIAIGATGQSPVKYIDTRIIKATTKSKPENWEVPDNIDVSSFDFSWVPHPEDPPYIYQFGTQWQKTGGPRYVVAGADEIKYVQHPRATRLPDPTNFNIVGKLAVKDFDYSWHPDETEEPYIYVFGNQWHAAEVMPTVEYKMPGATQYKYVNATIATLGPNMTHWFFNDDIDVSDFDFSWCPNPGEPEMIYEFATQWQKTGGPRYIVPGGIDIKYMDFQKAKKLPNKLNWTVPDNIDVDQFDFSWHPDDTSPPYVYVFATQWAFSGGPVYTVKGATEVKYIDDQTATATVNMDNWVVNETEIEVESFDFSWHPHVEDQPYIYQFGTQWQKTGGPRYISPGATDESPIKYIDTRILKARRLPNKSKFTILGGAHVRDFDWSWHPDDTSPPYSYQFGNQWYPAEEMPTVEYRVDGAREAKFMTEVVAKLAPIMDNWKVKEGINVSRFDFSWIPHPSATPYIYQFGTSQDAEDGPVYITPGNAGEIINVPRVEIDEDMVPVEPDTIDIVEDSDVSSDPAESLDMFFVDRGNKESTERFEKLKEKYGSKIQKTRYLNSWVDTINRCINRATSSLIWIINSELDYSNFDFGYYPNMWQMKMVHVFGTQHSHWGTTFLVNRESFPNDTKYIKIIEHLSNLNFVKNMRATATACLYDILLIDHGNKESNTVAESLRRVWTTGRNVTVIPYEESYLNTIRNYVKKLPEKKEHYLWICSTVCDYSKFDFTYICDPFSRENLHVFPSGAQKFGDTFLIDVNKTKEIINDLDRLEEYDKVNYNGAVKAQRLPEPIIVVNDDTHVSAINSEFGFPYAKLVTEDNLGLDVLPCEPMNLWSPETKNILVATTGATHIIAPAEIKNHVKKELYDYPYIKRAPKLAKSNPLDIVFLSNGETKADEHWEHLQNITNGLPNRVVRVDGVNGRAAAYHAAAEASETPWMFTVFAKLKVSPKFDWNWQPDRMQVPKHYIFHAKNPVNGLTYGHQAMIAYNKKLTLANEGRGLDFTLDDEHEIVPLISGTAHYNTDPFSTWRTAFREVLKLKTDDSEESRVRLDAWLNKAEGDFGQFSIKGALDAEEYYEEVNGEFDALKLSYEWAWLRKRFEEI